MSIIAKAKSAVALALLLAFVQPAFADLASDKAAVDAAKVAGTVGEQADGYLGYRQGIGGRRDNRGGHCDQCGARRCLCPDRGEIRRYPRRRGPGDRRAADRQAAGGPIFQAAGRSLDQKITLLFRGLDGACRLWHPSGRMTQALRGPVNSAGVVELVDAPDSKSGTERCVGSIPTARTIISAPVGATINAKRRQARGSVSRKAEFAGGRVYLIARFALLTGRGRPSLAFLGER